MTFSSIQPRGAALVFFDTLTYGFAKPRDTDAARVDLLKANWTRLAAAVRPHGVPVVYTIADHRPEGDDIAERYSDADHDLQPWTDPEIRRRPHTVNVSGSWGSQVIGEIAPQPGDYHIAKHRWSAFFQTHLELSLRSRKIGTIILCGGATEIGIASTAYAARDLDFDLVIVRDGTYSRRQFVHEFLLDHVFPRFARIRTTSEVIEMLSLGAAAESEHQ
jgi:nicotinamidase-related amidase